MDLSSKFQKTLLFLSLIAFPLGSCIMIPSVYEIPRPIFLPVPADIGTPTGNSPLSGDWSAQTDFGKLAFNIDPEGRIITTVYLQMDTLSCAGTTFTGEHQSQDSVPPWTIADGKFRVTLELGKSNDNQLHVSGEFDKAENKFSGDWRFVVYNGECTGTWQTASRN